MTVPSPAAKPGHHLKRLAAMLAIAFVAAIALVAGRLFDNGLAGKSNLLEGIGMAVVFYFAIFAACALLGLFFEILLVTASARKFPLPHAVTGLRAKIRRRWQGNRTDAEYSKAETALLIPLTAVVGLIFFSTLSWPVAMNAIIVMLMVITGYFIFSMLRPAYEKPRSTLITAAIAAFGAGYVLF